MGVENEDLLWNDFIEKLRTKEYGDGKKDQSEEGRASHWGKCQDMA